MPRKIASFVSLVVVLASAALAPGSATASGDDSLASLRRKISRAQHRTWYWQRVMQRRRWPSNRPSRASADVEAEQHVLHVWRHRRRIAAAHGRSPRHLRQFLCIHRHEGPWHADTGNGYYGGLQMDIRFQRQYGRWLLRTKGRASAWTPLEQIWVAERALREGRGYRPWPVSARRCGLL